MHLQSYCKEVKRSYSAVKLSVGILSRNGLGMDCWSAEVQQSAIYQP